MHFVNIIHKAFICSIDTVLYVYEQCLLCFGHCAEIWYEAALYLQRASETGVSVQYLTLGTHA